MGKEADLHQLSQLRSEMALVSQSPFVPDLDRVGWVYRAYTTNSAHLLRHIQVPHNDFRIAIETRVPGNNPQIYIEYRAELIRLLLNYTASVTALIDHARIMEKKLAITNPQEHKEYMIRRGKITEEGLTHFVKNLRNFVLHVDLPSTAGETSFSEGDVEFKFDTLLDTKKLLTWDGWDKESKRFLSESETISLANTVLDYDLINKKFYDWVFKEISVTLFNNARRMMELEIAALSLERRIAE